MEPYDVYTNPRPDLDLFETIAVSLLILALGAAGVYALDRFLPGDRILAPEARKASRGGDPPGEVAAAEPFLPVRLPAAEPRKRRPPRTEELARTVSGLADLRELCPDQESESHLCLLQVSGPSRPVQRDVVTDRDGFFKVTPATRYDLYEFRGFGNWRAAFGAPADEVLTAGLYRESLQTTDHHLERPYLEVGTLRKSGCRSATGSFRVHELERDPLGRPRRFAVSFEQHCPDKNPTLFGRLCFRCTKAAWAKGGRP